MDHNSVDNLARLLGSGQSRRRILKTLTGGALGAVATAVGIGGASAAKKRSAGNVCAKNSDCLSNSCIPQGRGRAICACLSPSDCPQATDQCHAATCAAGICAITVTRGVACTDGNLCTTGETCQPNGTCGGGTATVCTALGQCYDVGVCDPATGVCSNPTKQDGTACVNSDACAPNSTCQAGICTGTAITCPAASDQCHVAGTCDHSTGVCSAESISPSGAACSDGNPFCFSGACCPSGSEVVNGGCFEITGRGQTNCNAGCSNGFGNVAGSGNFLCGARTSTPCSSNANCPTGQACTTCCGAGFCIAAC